MKDNILNPMKDIKKYRYCLIFSGIKYSTPRGSFSWDGTLSIIKRFLKNEDECIYKMPCSEETLHKVLKSEIYKYIYTESKYNEYENIKDPDYKKDERYLKQKFEIEKYHFKCYITNDTFNQLKKSLTINTAFVANELLNIEFKLPKLYLERQYENLCEIKNNVVEFYELVLTTHRVQPAWFSDDEWVTMLSIDKTVFENPEIDFNNKNRHVYINKSISEILEERLYEKDDEDEDEEDLKPSYWGELFKVRCDREHLLLITELFKDDVQEIVLDDVIQYKMVIPKKTAKNIMGINMIPKNYICQILDYLKDDFKKNELLKR